MSKLTMPMILDLILQKEKSLELEILDLSVTEQVKKYISKKEALEILRREKTQWLAEHDKAKAEMAVQGTGVAAKPPETQQMKTGADWVHKKPGDNKYLSTENFPVTKEFMKLPGNERTLDALKELVKKHDKIVDEDKIYHRIRYYKDRCGLLIIYQPNPPSTPKAPRVLKDRGHKVGTSSGNLSIYSNPCDDILRFTTPFNNASVAKVLEEYYEPKSDDSDRVLRLYASQYLCYLHKSGDIRVKSSKGGNKIEYCVVENRVFKGTSKLKTDVPPIRFSSTDKPVQKAPLDAEPTPIQKGEKLSEMLGNQGEFFNRK